MEKLEEIVKKMNGDVLTIGYADNSDVIRILNGNKKLTSLYTLSKKNNSSFFGKNSRKIRFNRDKNVNIKKLRKQLKKYKFDYLVCDFETIMPFFRSFIKNSILLAGKKVYIETDNDEFEFEEIMKRYKAYGCKVEDFYEKKRGLFVIDTENIKVPFFKSILLWFRNIGYDIVEFIGNIMIG